MEDNEPKIYEVIVAKKGDTIYKNRFAALGKANGVFKNQCLRYPYCTVVLRKTIGMQLISILGDIKDLEE